MATGFKRNNTSVIDGESFQDAFGLTAAQAKNLDVVRLQSDNGERVIGWWDNATAFSVAEKAACINFPKGAVVYDIQAKVVWMKIAAAGTDSWAYSATMT
ncbi:MAG: hypothetical protein ACYDBV_13500 [Nitrospiria bacterium]